MVFTPDGPRGPRRRASGGVLVAAQRAGVPVIPIACLARPALHAGSWDRMEIPVPFARVCAIEGNPIVVPQGAGSLARERLRASLEHDLNEMTGRAGAILAGRGAC